MFEMPGHEVNSAETVDKSTVKLSRVLASAKVCLAPISAEPVQAGTDSVDDEVFDNIRDLKEKLGEVKDFTKFLESATEEMNGNIGGENDSKEG